MSEGGRGPGTDRIRINGKLGLYLEVASIAGKILLMPAIAFCIWVASTLWQLEHTIDERIATKVPPPEVEARLENIERRLDGHDGSLRRIEDRQIEILTRLPAGRIIGAD